jgi:vacuolar-type H+-ATPase subunit I/STV1
MINLINRLFKSHKNVDRVEKTANDVYKTMMALEQAISKEKKTLSEDKTNDEVMTSFSKNSFFLLIKRMKHNFYLQGEFEKGDKLEQLISQQKENNFHQIQANAIYVFTHLNLYDANLDDIFIEILTEFSDYLKPILAEVI